MERDSDNGSRRLGQGMIWAGWLLLLALLTLLFNERLESDRNPNRQVETRLGPDGVTEVRLQRNRHGHYVASGEINGIPVEFLLDTGASDVSVPAGVAGALGLKRGAAQTYRTANGLVTAHLTVIESVRLGGIEQRNVKASIHPGIPDDTVLLGMSFLKRVELIQRGEELILRQVH